MDAWNTGHRPDVDDYLARADEPERGELAELLMSFISLAPTPAYSDEALAAIRAEPVVAEALAAAGEGAGLFPALLARFRARFAMSTDEVAGELVELLRLPEDQQAKTAGYLERLEHGELEPARVSRRVFDALARVFRVPREQLEGAADMSGWARRVPAPTPVFRADKDAAMDVSRHLEVLADALEAPGVGGRDEVDDLFLGGR
jgi:hypothetical protein